MPRKSIHIFFVTFPDVVLLLRATKYLFLGLSYLGTSTPAFVDAQSISFAHSPSKIELYQQTCEPVFQKLRSMRARFDCSGDYGTPEEHEYSISVMKPVEICSAAIKSIGNAEFGTTTRYMPFTRYMETET